MTFHVEAYGKLSESQAGFRKGYYTTHNAFVLYSTITKYQQRKRKPVYISGCLYKTIMSIYASVKGVVKIKSGLSNIFDCPLG